MSSLPEALEPIPQFDLEAQHRAIARDLERALSDVLESGRFVLGPQVAQLEAALAARVGARYGVGCASGTDALLLPLRDLARRHDVQGPADARRTYDLPEVVVPAFTFFATAGAVWNAGLRPAFCDVEDSSFNVSAQTVSSVRSARTLAAVAVHLFGQMADVEAIRRALGPNVFVLEDAAQAIGARRRADGVDASAGGAGDAGAFSFFPTKNLGGLGDGGLITTSDEVLATRLRELRVHGGGEAYHHDVVGTNSRLDTLQAAVLLAKLPHLDRWLEARRRNAALYDELLADLKAVRTPRAGEGNFHTYHQYTIRAERRDGLRAFLTEAGIGTGVYYPLPLHLQPCFRPLGYAPGDFPVAERLCGEVLSLPVFPELGEKRLRAVAAAIRTFYKA